MGSKETKIAAGYKNVEYSLVYFHRALDNFSTRGVCHFQCARARCICLPFIILTHNSAGIPAVLFKEPLPAYSPAHTMYYFQFERNNAMNAMETIDGEPCICIE
jgi:hypothetical protein